MHDCRQNEISVQRQVADNNKKPRNMKTYESFQKKGKICVDVLITEKVAQSNLPEDNFMQREPSPKDGYRSTVWFSDATSEAIGEMSQ